jgi:integrase
MTQIKKRTVANGDARYDVRWRTPDQKVRNQTFSRKRDADDFVTKLNHDRMTGYSVDPAGGRKTVAALAEQWLQSNPGKRANTIGRDRSALNAHILPALGAHQLRTVHQADVQRLVNGWTEHLAPSTVGRTYGTLRAAFGYAVTADLIGRSPCRDIKMPVAVRRKRPVLGPEDVAALAGAVDERYRAMVWVAALLGLRWGEVAGLRVGRLDFLNRTLTVSEIVTRDAHGRSVSGPPKSEAGLRTVSMPEVLVEVLAEYLAQSGLTAADSDAYVFPAPGGGPWAYANFRRRIWLPATVAADLKGAGFHDLRRTAATAMVIGNVDLKTAGNRLGHSDPRLTIAVYAQATTEADRGAADTVGRQFSAAMEGPTGNGPRDGRAMKRGRTRDSRGANPG